MCPLCGNRLFCRLTDVRRRQPVHFKQRRNLAGTSERVVDADADDGTGASLAHAFRNGGTERPDDIMLLCGHNRARFTCGCKQNFFVNRLDGMDIDYPRRG